MSNRTFSPVTLLSIATVFFFGFGEVFCQQLFPDPFGEPINKSISFWKNDGQIVDTEGNLRPDIRFVSEGTQPRAYLMDRGKVSLTYGERDQDSVAVTRAARIDILPVNGASLSIPVGSYVKDYQKHYWLEHTAPDPVTNVLGYNWLKYTNLYPGIDWHWYGGSAGTKMAFVCQPGSNPRNIMLQIDGQDSLKIDWEGALKIYLNQKWVEFKQAVAYQYDQNGNITFMNWTASYGILNGSTVVKFNYDGYNPNLPLVFFIGHEPLAMGGDPDNIPYSTYLGTGMKDEINEIAVAANGDYYVVGDIEDYQFPATVGLVPVPPSTQTGMIAKYDVNYVTQWVGYYGKKLRSIALDETNNRIIVGGNNATYGGLFTQQFGSGYVLNSGWGTAGNSSIAMFSIASGSPPSLLWSTRWRSSTINKVLVDGLGNIYIAGSIYQSIPLFIQQPADPSSFYQSTNHGQLDGYLASFDVNTSLRWSTYYGGEEDDYVLDMALNQNNDRLAIVGRTESIGHVGAGNCQLIPGWLPQCSGGGAYFQPYHNGNGQNGGTAADGFIAWFTPELDWLWSTRIGGPSDEHITSAAFAPDGSFYIAGYIGYPEIYCNTQCVPSSPANQGFPHCVWTSAADQAIYEGQSEHFVASFGSDRILRWSRFAGGSGYEFAGFASSPDITNGVYPMNGPVITVDEAGDIYLAGSTTTGGSAYPNDFVQTVQNSQYYSWLYNNGIYESPGTDRSDIYVMKFDHSTGGVVMGTFFGGRYGIPINQFGADLNQDVITCMTTRDSRLFIGGTTASTIFFPVSALDGVANSFQQFTPPANQANEAADLTNAFVAQLSWTRGPVGLNEINGVQNGSIIAWFGTGSNLIVQPPVSLVGQNLVIDLFDMQGRLIASQSSVFSERQLELGLSNISTGVYVGQIRHNNLTFKVLKP